MEFDEFTKQRRATPEEEATELIVGMPLPKAFVPVLDVRDAMGGEVPPYLRQVFNGRRQLLEIIADIEKVSRTIGREGLLEHTKHLDINRIQNLLALAGDLIRTGAPFVPCDCEPRTLDCPKCDGDLWIPARESRETLSIALRPRSMEYCKRSQSLGAFEGGTFARPSWW